MGTWIFKLVGGWVGMPVRRFEYMCGYVGKCVHEHVNRLGEWVCRLVGVQI